MLGGRQVQLDPFYEKPLFKVFSVPRENRNEPRVEVKQDPLVIIIRLVKMGYGDIETVKRMNSREVLQAIQYEKFTADYQAAYMELNKRSSK